MTENTEEELVEMWLPVVGYEGLYEVSSHGRVRSLDRVARRGRYNAPQLLKGRVLAQDETEGRYPTVALCRSGKQGSKSVHSLVLTAFAGPRSSGQTCRHLDGNRRNNRITNLAWGTRQENEADKFRHGTSIDGERHYKALFTEQQVLEMRQLSRDGVSPAEISRRFNANYGTVRTIVIGRSWRHVTALSSPDVQSTE